MHEFSLCESILKQVIQHAEIQPAKVATITVWIGSLAGVDIASLQFWFPVVAKKVAMPNVTLSVEIVPAQACCQHCLTQFNLQALYAACPKCGSYADYQLIQGKELVIKSVSLQR